jgi:hypothetical protein
MESFRTVIEVRHVMERDIGYSMWAVDEKATSAFVGQCGIRPVDEGAGPEVDLAYHFNAAAWNKGYATEAAIAGLVRKKAYSRTNGAAVEHPARHRAVGPTAPGAALLIRPPGHVGVAPVEC